MFEWRTTTWGAVASLEYGKALRGYQEGSGDVPVYGTNGPVGWTHTRQAEGPGVIVGRKGAYRGVHYSPRDFWVIDTAFYLRPLERMSLRWAYYAMVNLDINSMDSGSAIPSTSRADFYALPVSVPPLAEQEAIADVLGALDDKIGLNKRIADTAEELALSLSSGSLWTKRVPLGDLCFLRKNQVSPQEILDGCVDHYSLPAFDAGKMPERVSPESIKSSKFSITEPVVLFSKLNPDIPRVWNAEVNRAVPSLASTEFLVLAPRGTLTTHELWAVAAQQEFRDELVSKVTGTSKSHQRVRPAEVLTTEVVDPRQFGDTSLRLRSLGNRAASARGESRTLAALRDTLLPQLMSGRLRVKDAEKMVEDHA
ncbi:restriction endonuclease subunit S [Streptomyces sp. HC307]|uniref:restriction endonuclease subunit S n=1 Tax=Streptomyces flavusporus TaxID=3385496 RepID=UPI003916DBEA